MQVQRFLECGLRQRRQKPAKGFLTGSKLCTQEMNCDVWRTRGIWRGKVCCGFGRGIGVHACCSSPHAWSPTQWGKDEHLARLHPSAFTEQEGEHEELFSLSFLSSS